MNSAKHTRIILPVDITYLPAIQAFVGELAKTRNISTKDLDLLQLAVEEAVTNVIEHAFLPDENATFEIVIEHSPLAFTVRVHDKGLPFDPSFFEAAEAETAIDNFGGPGLGLRLMKNSVDSVIFNNLGLEGKEVVITKFIHQKHIEEYFSRAHLNAFEECPDKPLKPRQGIPFKVQLLAPEQAIQVAQCAYRAYGYTYVMENVYYPERLIEMTRTGALVSAIAVSIGDGEVMSHLALESFGRKHGVPELGMGFTKPEFRGMECLNCLSKFLLNYAKENGIKGVYGKAVTTHTISQRTLKRYEFQPCALLLGHSPPKQFSRMEKSLDQRETLVLSYRQITHVSPVRIHVPHIHGEVIERILRRIGFPFDYAPCETEDPLMLSERQFHAEYDVNNRLQLANIHIENWEIRAEQEVYNGLKYLCRKGIRWIGFFLDLTDPNVDLASRFLEKQGCFFAGIFPSHPRPFIVFQYLNNVDVAYKRIMLHEESASELLDYVKECNPDSAERLFPVSLNSVSIS